MSILPDYCYEPPHIGVFIVLCSSCCFTFGNFLVGKFGVPSAAHPRSWKWRNISMSFIHSLISGICTILCFYEEPGMATDIVGTYTLHAYILVTFSIGYFIYDTLDMVIHQPGQETYELVPHHVGTIMCYSITMFTQTYVAFALTTLIAELNSIFLHLRQLLRLYGFKRSQMVYRVNSVINIATFVAFRITTLAWITRWLVLNRALVPSLPIYTIGLVSAAYICFENILVFNRLVYGDFLKKVDLRSMKKVE